MSIRYPVIVILTFFESNYFLVFQQFFTTNKSLKTCQTPRQIVYLQAEKNMKKHQFVIQL